MSTDFQRRYDNAKPSYIKTNEKRFADLPAGSSVLIPSPQDIEAVVNDLDGDEAVSLTDLRTELASRHGADGCCPVMAGMNLRVAAEVTFQAMDAGVPVDQVVPIWKAIDPAGTLAPKLPGGIERVRSLRGGVDTSSDTPLDPPLDTSSS